MAAEPLTGGQEIWRIASLYAGIIPNAALLESVGTCYQLAGNFPRLCLLLIGYGVFLGL